MIHLIVPGATVRPLLAPTPATATSEPSPCSESSASTPRTTRRIAVCTGERETFTLNFDFSKLEKKLYSFRRNSHKLQKRGSMPESSGAVSLVKHYGQYTSLFWTLDYPVIRGNTSTFYPPRPVTSQVAERRGANDEETELRHQQLLSNIHCLGSVIYRLVPGVLE